MLRHSFSRLVTTVALGAILVHTNGCFDSSTGPSDSTEAPAMPSAERLTFDFGFFQEPPALERASYNNFFNAYIRGVVAGAVTELLLTPPVYAFSLALHTPPTHQEDGSWLWIYTYSQGSEEVQIRLRGEAIDRERVAWQLRVTNLAEGIDKALWFEGETWNDADAGYFVFSDFENGLSDVSRIDWGSDSDGNFLRLTDQNDNPGDSLEFREKGSDKSFTWSDDSDPDQSWYVKWNEATQAGSLRAPDYNGGEKACWDENHRDTVCPDAS